MLCQAPRCDVIATHRAVESDGNAILLCTPHADYVRDGNQEVRESRKVTVEPLEGTA